MRTIQQQFQNWNGKLGHKWALYSLTSVLFLHFLWHSFEVKHVNNFDQLFQKDFSRTTFLSLKAVDAPHPQNLRGALDHFGCDQTTRGRFDLIDASGWQSSQRPIYSISCELSKIFTWHQMSAVKLKLCQYLIVWRDSRIASQNVTSSIRPSNNGDCYLHASHFATSIWNLVRFNEITPTQALAVLKSNIHEFKLSTPRPTRDMTNSPCSVVWAVIRKKR